MAEFVMEGVGGTSPASPSKKKKIDKKVIYIIGAVVIVGYLLLSRKSSGAVAQDEAVYLTDGYPDNNVDTEAQMQNFQSIMAGQLDATLGSFATQMDAELNQLKTDNTQAMNELKTDIGESSHSMINQATSQYQQQLEQIVEKNKPVGVVAPDVTKSNSWTVGQGVGDGASLGALALKTGNQNLLNKEIDRATSVIAYRKEQGLNTTDQQKYLTSLTNKGK